MALWTLSSKGGEAPREIITEPSAHRVGASRTRYVHLYDARKLRLQGGLSGHIPVRTFGILKNEKGDLL